MFKLFQHVDSWQKMSATGLVVFDRTCTVPSAGFADKSAKVFTIFFLYTDIKPTQSKYRPHGVQQPLGLISWHYLNSTIV
jgi:hypothetical protein